MTSTDSQLDQVDQPDVRHTSVKASDLDTALDTALDGRAHLLAGPDPAGTGMPIYYLPPPGLRFDEYVNDEQGRGLPLRRILRIEDDFGIDERGPLMEIGTSLCTWFAGCDQLATHVEPHPVLHGLAACDRCPTIGTPEAIPQ